MYHISVNKYIYLPTVCEFVDACTFAVIANTWDKHYISQTLGWAKGPSDNNFLKNVDLNLKMWTFTRDFLKSVDLNLKMWTLKRYFPKNVDVNLKKCGPSRVIF